MNNIILWLIITLIALVVGFGVGYYIKKVMTNAGGRRRTGAHTTRPR